MLPFLCRRRDRDCLRIALGCAAIACVVALETDAAGQSPNRSVRLGSSAELVVPPPGDGAASQETPATVQPSRPDVPPWQAGDTTLPLTRRPWPAIEPSAAAARTDLLQTAGVQATGGQPIGLQAVGTHSTGPAASELTPKQPLDLTTMAERTASATATTDGKTPIGRTGRSSSGERELPSLGGAVWAATGCVLLMGLTAAGLLRLVRRKLPASLAPLPREVCEVLGRRRLDARTQLTMVRLDSRILVVALGPDGARTLTELTDPVEIDRLAGLCRVSASGGDAMATATPGGVFQSLLARRQSDATPASSSATRPADATRPATRSGSRDARAVVDPNAPADLDRETRASIPRPRTTATRLDVSTP